MKQNTTRFTTHSFLLFILFITACTNTYAQVQVSPRYSVDGAVNAMVTKGDSLIIAGDFLHVGLYTGSGLVLNDSATKANGNFPKLVGDIYLSTPDSAGGFYIYGNFRTESDGRGSAFYRIEHVLPDFSFEPGFSLPVNSLFPLKALLFTNNQLYIGGEYVNQIGGMNAGNLAAFNVQTRQLVTGLPVVTGKVEGIHYYNNSLYINGSFTDVGGLPRNGLAAIAIPSGTVKPWNPLLGSSYADLCFYKNRVVLGGNFKAAASNGHACALVDTLTGQSSIQYIFNTTTLYQAAAVQKVLVTGDTLYTYSWGTFDTRVTAVNLRNTSIIWQKYFNMIATASDMKIQDSTLFIGGASFTAVYKTNTTNAAIADTQRTVRGIVKLNIHTGALQDWLPDPLAYPNGDVHTISLSRKKIFIGGNYTHWQCSSRSGVLLLNMAKEEILPFRIDCNQPSISITAAKLIDSTLYLAGNFYKVNGQDYPSSIIGCNIKTGRLLPLPPVQLGNILAIEADRSNVYVGGQLTEPAGGLNRVNLMALERATGKLTSWAPNPDGSINPFSLHFSDGRLYAGGYFTHIAGQTRSKLASFDSASLALTAWAPATPEYFPVTAITAAKTTLWVATSYQFIGINKQSGLVETRYNTASEMSGVIHSLTTKGQFVVAGGKFSNNGSPCNNLMLFDTLTNSYVSPAEFCQSFGIITDAVKCLAFSGNDLYIGGSFTNLNSTIHATNVERIRFPAGYFLPPADSSAAIDSSYTYYPQSGGNGGDVSINFYGNLIAPGMRVKLVAAGRPDIVVPDSLTYFPGNHRMSITMDLRNKATGVYDIVITRGSYQKTFSKGFTVEDFVKPDILVSVLGPNTMRNGLKEVFQLSVTNTGNANARAVPLWLVTSANLQTRLLIPVMADSSGKDLDTMILTPIDTLHGKPFSGDLQLFLIPEIKAGEVLNIPLEAINNGGEFVVEAMVGMPLMQSPFDKPTLECVSAATNLALEFFDLDAATDCLSGLAFAAEEIIQRGTTPEIGQSNLSRVASLTWPAAKWAVDCIQAVAEFTPVGRMAKLASKIGGTLWDMYEKGEAASEVGSKCGKLFPDKWKQKAGGSVNAVDPNDKIGIGVAHNHYISGLEPLLYGIRFENIKTATAAAQTVSIVDTLDATKMDLSSFQLGAFTFGKLSVTPGPGLKSCTEYADLRPGKNLVVKISAGLNDTTGVFTTTFTSLDPTTMQPTKDAVAGFLPPNIMSPEGEGAVYFSIKLKPGLPAKTVIRNKALIYFDFNAPIATPTFSNTIDLNAPATAVQSLPAATKDSVFTVAWKGTDDAAGIEYYNIYCAANNGPYKPLLLRTATSSLRFKGQVDSSYSFYSESVDSLGRTERKTAADTKTTVVNDVNQVQVYPNPNTGSFTLLANPQNKIKSMSLFDQSGKQIPINYSAVSNRYEIRTANSTANGIYLLSIETDNGMRVITIVISR